MDMFVTVPYRNSVLHVSLVTGISSGMSPDSHFVVTQAETSLPNSTDLGALATGLLKGTVSGGISTVSSIVDNSPNWDAGYTYRLLSASGTTPLTLTLFNNVLSGSIVQASASVSGYLSATDWLTFNSKQSTLTFTNSVQNTSGTVNLVGDSTSPGNSYYYGTNGSGTKGFYVLPSSMVYPNAGIPISTGSAWGTSITDNHSNWDAGYTYRVTSVTDSATGLDFTLLSNNITLAVTSGYVIPTTTEETNWNTAYGWGNHALAGYLTSSTGLLLDQTSPQNVLNGAPNFTNGVNVAGIYYTASTMVGDSAVDTSGNVYYATAAGLRKLTTAGSDTLVDAVANSMLQSAVLIANDGSVVWGPWNYGHFRRSATGAAGSFSDVGSYTAGAQVSGPWGRTKDNLGYLYFSIYTSAFGINQQTIHRSMDNGANWSVVFTGTGQHLHDVAADPYQLGYIYATCDPGDTGDGWKIIRSTNNGTDWTTIITGVGLLKMNFLSGIRLFAEDGNYGRIYLTTDDTAYTEVYRTDTVVEGFTTLKASDGRIYWGFVGEGTDVPRLISTTDGYNYRCEWIGTDLTAWTGIYGLSENADGSLNVGINGGVDLPFRFYPTASAKARIIESDGDISLKPTRGSVFIPVGGLTIGSEEIAGDNNLFVEGTLTTNDGTHADGATHYRMYTTDELRWAWGLKGTETGANAGSNLSLFAYSDAEGYLWAPLSITRSTGVANFERGMSAGSTGQLSVDISGVATIPTVNFGSSTGVSATAAAGVLTLAGIGGTNNENLLIDFDVLNGVAISSTTGATVVYWNDISFNIDIDEGLRLGSQSTVRAKLGAESTGNDSIQFGLVCGAAATSGYYSLMEYADMGNANRSPLATSVDPVLRIYSSDATIATPYIEAYHNNTDAYINTGLGDIVLSPASNNVDIGIGAAGVDYTLTFNGETNDGVITWQEDEDTFDMACNLVVNGALTSTSLTMGSTTIVEAGLSTIEYTTNKDQPNGYPGLNEDGDLVGIIIPRRGTTAEIDTIVLDAGELATTSDTNTFRIGDGLTSGGINMYNIDLNSTTAFTVEQSGVYDNALVVDTTNGRVGIGIDPSFPLHFVYEHSSGGVAHPIYIDISNVSSTSTGTAGMQVYVMHTGSGAGSSLSAITGNSYVNNTGATVAEATAILGSVGSIIGTITDARCFRSYSTNFGILGSFTGYYVDNPLNIGTITTAYGLYVETLNVGSTNYAIYTNSGQVRFGDKVGLGVDPGDNFHIFTNNTQTTPHIYIEQDGSGDAAVEMGIVGDSYIFGIDNSDGDKFKISYNSTQGSGVLGTNDRLTIDSSGNIAGLVTIAVSKALTTTSTDGFILDQSTAATSGTTKRMSPRLRWSADVWNGSASVAVNYIAEAVPLMSGADHFSSLNFKVDEGVGSYTSIGSWFNNGSLLLSSNALVAGWVAPTERLFVESPDAVVDAVTNVLGLYHAAGTFATVGCGTGLVFYGDWSSSSYQEVANIESVLGAADGSLMNLVFGVLGANKMYLSNLGYLGIGTSDFDGTPAVGMLTVQGSTNDGSTNIFVGRDSDGANVAWINTNGNLFFGGNTESGASGLRIFQNNTDSFIDSVTDAATGALRFRTNTGTDATERMRITSGGHVLINSTDDDGTPATGMFVVKGSTNDGSTNILVGRDSDEANVATLDTNGKMSLTSDAVAVKPTATIVIASSTSRGKDAADYVCDGTNDEVQIQAAIDALGVEGGTICLLEGTYTIAAVITIDKRITITGQQSGDKGGGTKLVLANAADCDMFDLVPAVGASTTHYQLTRFEHLMLDGNKANQTAATKAIDQNEGSAVDLTLYDIWFDSWKGYCIDLQQYWDWHIFRCVFEHNDTYAIHLEHVNSHAPTTGWIKDCFYPSVIQDGTDRSTRLIIEGNYINTSDAFNNFDLWCSNLIFKSNMTNASAAVRTANTYTILKINSTTGGTNTNNYVISDNIFNETGDKYAIDIGGGGTTIINRMVIEGNVFQFSDGASIIHNTGTGQLANFIVSGNTFQGQDDNSMKGVYVGNSNVSNISDNTFINFATGVDISDASCYNPIVSGNNFDACTTPVTAGGSGTYNPLVYGNKTGNTKDFIVPDAGKLQANSLGDDKNIQVYHDDTNGQIVTSSGNLILAPNGTTVTVYPKILDVDTIQNYNDIVLKTYDGGSYDAALTVHGAGGTQTIQMNAYGAGALTTDASGNIVATSDERQKDIQGNFTRGLKDLKDISPIFYKWKPETGYDTEHVYAGLSAQNVQKNIPEAVMANEEGYLGLQDRPIIATLINAINEQQKEINSLKARLDGLV